jgi:hypothetical protein
MKIMPSSTCSKLVSRDRGVGTALRSWWDRQSAAAKDYL